jgi:hypothetical protein
LAAHKRVLRLINKQPNHPKNLENGCFDLETVVQNMETLTTQAVGIASHIAHHTQGSEYFREASRENPDPYAFSL